MAEFSAAKCKEYEITEQIFYGCYFLKVNRVNSIEYTVFELQNIQ
jgi:hypothetical protein